MSDQPAPHTQDELQRTVLEVGAFLSERKARQVLVLDLQELTTLTDYFVICTVRSMVHGRALVRDLDRFLRERRLRPFSRETGFASPWVLLDYNYFIVHLFLEDARSYYQLEKLWSDAEVLYEHDGEL
ncbi:MAG: ribosome silencing factor [Spirochaetota bacterium]